MFDNVVLADIRNHATACWPDEACGAVVDGAFVPCPNVAGNPRTGFHIANEVVSALRASGTIEAIVHSHPDGWACPSALDMARQQHWDIPFGIVVSHESGSEAPIFFGRQVPMPPLVGRGFRHGVTDCKSLLDDWFLKQRGITLLDKPRDWEWWRRSRAEGGRNLYQDFFREAGFRDIAEAELRPGDCVLFAIRSDRPSHVGIYVDGGRILHHPSGMNPVDPAMLSRHDHFHRWRRHAVRFARHDG